MTDEAGACQGMATAKAVKKRKTATKGVMRRENILNKLKGVWEAVLWPKRWIKGDNVVRTAGEAERAEALRADSTCCYTVILQSSSVRGKWRTPRSDMLHLELRVLPNNLVVATYP